MRLVVQTRLFIALSLFLVAAPSLADSYAECNGILIAQNVSVLQTKSRYRFYLMKAMDKESYDAARHSANVDVPGYFTGDWASDSAHYGSELSTENVDYTREEALSALSMVGRPEATSAWRACILSRAKGLFAFIEGSPTGTTFTVTLHWDPPVGLGNAPLQIEPNKTELMIGPTATPLATGSSLSQGDLKLNISRPSASSPIRGTVNGQAQAGHFAATIFVPGIPSSDPRVSFDRVYVSDISDITFGNLHGDKCQLCLDRLYWEPDIWIAGVRYLKGVGMHPSQSGIGYAEIPVPKGARYLLGVVGFAEDRRQSRQCAGSGNARVILENAVVAQWHLGGTWDAHYDVLVPLPASLATIRLETDAAGDGNWCDQITWGSLRFSGAPN